MEFSDGLIKRCKKYFKNRCGKELSDEQASEALASFARLFKIAGEIDDDSQKNK